MPTSVGTVRERNAESCPHNLSPQCPHCCPPHRLLDNGFRRSGVACALQVAAGHPETPAYAHPKHDGEEGNPMGQKLTVHEAAEALHISLRGVRRLISTGELRAYRVGSTVTVRVDADDIAELLKPVVPERAKQNQPPTQPPNRGEMTTTATPLRPCPTPHRVPYQTRGTALAGFDINAQTHPHRPYRCRCGYWHMTSARLRNRHAR